MGKEMKTVGEGHKTVKISEYIKHGADQYFSYNADIYGRVFVSRVLVSDDCRSARIFISVDQEKDIGRVIKLLKKNTSDVSSYIKKRFSSKYFPKIKFEGYNEEIGF